MNGEEPTIEDRARTVTRLLAEAGESGRVGAETILPWVYEELRALARSKVAAEADPSALDATALVHEAYLRLVGEEARGFRSRAHFFGAAALAMRRILVDAARRRSRPKHGGDRDRVELGDGAALVPPPDDDVLAIDEAVRVLEKQDPRKARIVNLRYFAGLTNEETAEALEVSLGTIEREWRFIKVWLRERLDGDRRDRGLEAR